MLSNIEIQRLARNIVDRLEQNNVASFLSKKEQVINQVSDIIKSNFDAEKKLELEAKLLIDKLIEQSDDKSLDSHKMFKMAKKRLAEKKGFVL